MINGIINIYKEKGYTSHDVVAKMRGIVRQKKIGHTGTLDPQAEGVLPVCLGNATKLCDMLTDKDKEYVAELLLGISTDTQDMTGKILKERAVDVTTEQVQAAIALFVGTYAQIPPMYSAIKINGKKLYELAREGKEVERAARLVNIYEIEILEMALPRVKIRVACSKGTYIRTLCHDIGEKLGCGGTMEHLLRTRAGMFLLSNAITLSKLLKLRDEENLQDVVFATDKVFAHLPACIVDEIGTKLVLNGNSFLPIHGSLKSEACIEGKQIRVYVMERFIGIYEYKAKDLKYFPVKMFLSE